MDSRSEERHELIGGPWDGHVVYPLVLGVQLKDELCVPLEGPKEYRRVGRYRRRDDGDYDWVGEVVLRDVSYHEME